MQNPGVAKVKSVGKALDLLSLLIFDDPQRNGQSLSALAGKLGLPNNTAHSLLQTLVGCGYACQTESGLYASGDVCRQIGTMNVLHSQWAIESLLPEMRAFSVATDTDAIFTVLGGGKRIVAAQSEGNGAVRINLSAMESKAFYSMPTSRILTAWATETELTQIVDQNGFPAELWEDAETLASLKELCAGIRQQGYVRMDETAQGLYSCAVPVFRKDETVLGALGAYVSLYNLSEKRKEHLVHELRALAQRIQS